VQADDRNPQPQGSPLNAQPRPGRILVVDDTESNAQLLRKLLERDGHLVSVSMDSSATLTLVKAFQPDLVFLDVMMPRPDGFDLCRALKADPTTVLIPVVLITALRDTTDRVKGIEAGADDFITKPLNFIEFQARVRALLRLKRYTDELDSAESVILSLAMTVEARDLATEGHCQRLASYATRMGRALNLDAEDLGALERGGYLHDVGKIGIPDAILLKPDSLTAEEYGVMRQHTLIGDKLCGELRSLARVRPIIRHHHERLDGSGYPDGLQGDAIPLLAQIMSIVDVFDALTTARPYKPALTVTEALDELHWEASRGWRCPDLVNVLALLVQPEAVPAP
jgi:putative two-component system response regulator